MAPLARRREPHYSSRMNLTREVQALVAAFTVEIAVLAKQEALRHGSKSFGAHKPQPAAWRPSKNDKRSPAQLGEIKQSLFEHLASHPGMRTEQLNAAFGTSTKELALPLRQLVAEGAIRTEGQRRGMRYYAGGTSKPGRRGKRRKSEA